jgi:hypothetical protein
VVRTAFGAEDQTLLFTVLSRVTRPFLKTPARGAATSIYLASSPEVAGVGGAYFANRKPKRANKLAYDPALRARLWRVSAELTHLSNNSTQES